MFKAWALGRALAKAVESLDSSAAMGAAFVTVAPDWETGLEGLTAAGGGAGIKNWETPRTMMQETRKNTTRLLLSKTIPP